VRTLREIQASPYAEVAHMLNAYHPPPLPSARRQVVIVDPFLEILMRMLGARIVVPTYGAMSDLQSLMGNRPLGMQQDRGAPEDYIEAHSLKFDLAEGSSLIGKPCPICLEELKLGDQVRTLVCFHTMHRTCVDEWLHINKNCPVCKTDIDTPQDVPEMSSPQSSSSSASSSSRTTRSPERHKIVSSGVRT
jgi:hypothetical protein